jgi:protein-S-isoprenylcysteine O-methyltransferase Ste14
MSPDTRETAADLSARVAVGFLFVMLSINLLGDFIRTQHLTAVLLLISEALVVVFTIVRRRACVVDRSAAARIATAMSLAGPPLLRTMDGGALLPDEITALMLTGGLLAVIAGKVTLGRSFGIAPANRGIVAGGPYLLVRHPIYAGYLLTHIAFLIAHPRPWNIAVVILADAALVVRALFEERVLVNDERYRAYCSRVGWHLVPGVF